MLAMHSLQRTKYNLRVQEGLAVGDEAHVWEQLASFLEEGVKVQTTVEEPSGVS
jgi:hypothetical protein